MERYLIHIALLISISLHLLPMLLYEKKQNDFAPKVFVTSWNKAPLVAPSRGSQNDKIKKNGATTNVGSEVKGEVSKNQNDFESDNSNGDIQIELTYPIVSRRLGEEGVVHVQFSIGEDGRAKQIEVTASSGFTRLDLAAKEAIARTQFKQMSVQTMEMAIKFELNK